MKKLNVAMIGTGFMGRGHSLALAALPIYFASVPCLPVRKVVVDVTQDIASQARTRFGFEEDATRWQDIVRRDDIDVVNICTPNHSHAEIAIAAAQAGKHILCEKPLANTAAEAKAMLDAAQTAKITHMIGHDYRHTPAVVLAKKMIEEGRIGKILAYRGHYLQDWSADPAIPLSWRFQKSLAGSGALGDIGSHIIDISRYLIGEISSVHGLMQNFISERPVQTGAFDKMGASSRETSGPKGKVDVDDRILTMLRFANGVVGTLEASRNSYGRNNYLGFEVNGSHGSILFNYERMNELQVMFADDPVEFRGFRSICIGPSHPYGDDLWPVPGLGIGYIDVKLIEFLNFFQAIMDGRPGSPSFADGYQMTKINAAIETSSKSGCWENV